MTARVTPQHDARLPCQLWREGKHTLVEGRRILDTEREEVNWIWP